MFVIVVRLRVGSRVNGLIHGAMVENVFQGKTMMIAWEKKTAINSAMVHGASTKDGIQSVHLFLVRIKIGSNGGL